MNTPEITMPCKSSGDRCFIVVTMQDLPEAWYLVEYLLARGQSVAVMNACDRTATRALRELGRLRREYGIRYAGGVMAGWWLRSRHEPPARAAFPEINAEKVASLRERVPVYDAADLNDRKALAFLRAREPDYILVAGAPELRREFYTHARFGAFSRHLGIWPLYRGSDCPIWTLAAGDFDYFGYTIHRVSSRAEGTDVLLQRRVGLMPDETFWRAMVRVSRAGSDGFIEVLDATIDGLVLPGMEGVSEGRYYPPATFAAIRKARVLYAAAVQALTPSAA